METTRLIPGHVHPRAAMMQGCHFQLGVTVGARTKVWQFASLIRKARIGEDCVVAAYAMIDGARVGNRTIIGSGAFICPGVEIGDDVFIGPGVRTCNDAWPRTDKEGFDAEELISGRVTVIRVGNGASIGESATILPGVTIGSRAMIAAGCVVDDDVPADCLLKRNGEVVLIDHNRKNERMRSVV